VAGLLRSRLGAARALLGKIVRRRDSDATVRWGGNDVNAGYCKLGGDFQPVELHRTSSVGGEEALRGDDGSSGEGRRMARAYAPCRAAPFRIGQRASMFTRNEAGLPTLRWVTLAHLIRAKEIDTASLDRSDHL
jgi:hypothetical protein